jgi:CTP synthase (UTP-ammonia lyase)
VLNWIGLIDYFSEELVMNHLLRIGVIGDFDPSYPSHLATDEALKHAADALSLTLKITWLPTPLLDDRLPVQATPEDPLLNPYDGLWCSPGSPYQSMEGALKAIRFAREHNRPFVGT